MYKLNLKNKIKKEESGYILAFTLIIMAILLTISLSVTRIINRGVIYSRLIENSRVAYFVADSGMECAEYLDQDFRDDSLGISLLLNSSETGGPYGGKTDFENNLIQNIFFASSTVFNSHTDIDETSSLLDIEKNIYCASDGTYNQIFNTDTDEGGTAYAISADEVIENLNNKKSSYNIIGDDTHATTTFGLLIKNVDSNGNNVYRCALIVFGKTRFSNATNTTSYFNISSTGYSSCDAGSNSRVSRTIFKYFTD